MKLLKETKHLLLKEIKLELRQKYSISGILLYVISTVFVVYITLGQQEGGAIWAVLFWIIVLFASVNAIAKSFVQESAKRQLYYYTLVQPSSVILAKMIYNSLLLLCISFLAYFFLSVVLDDPVKDKILFYETLVLGSIGFSITFTFISLFPARPIRVLR